LKILAPGFEEEEEEQEEEGEEAPTGAKLIKLFTEAIYECAR
jgi:hypothetical protein